MDFSERGLRPQSSHVSLSDYSAGPASQWTTSVPASPSAHFKEGDRVVLHEDLRDNEHFDPLFFASAEDEVVTGVVLFALPPRGSEEQRCVLVARERDCSYQNALFFRGSHLQLASDPCVYRRGDRVKLSQPRSDTTAPIATAIICRSGHACGDFNYPNSNHSCDVCGAGISANSPGCMRCGRCDYDVCARCVTASSASTSAPQPTPPTGCIAHPGSCGFVVNTGSIRDGIQRNVLVVCSQSGAYSLYPASSLVHCSSSLVISSDTERDSLVDDLVRLNPSIEQVGMNKLSITGLISQFGSKFW